MHYIETGRSRGSAETRPKGEPPQDNEVTMAASTDFLSADRICFTRCLLEMFGMCINIRDNHATSLFSEEEELKVSCWRGTSKQP